MKTKFLLLLGVSGVGKTSIINELQNLDNRFVYISPYVTRPLRLGEVDKISISESTLMSMKEKKSILTINYLYGVAYCTPKEPIKNALKNNLFPVLDWPVFNLEIMEEEFRDQLLRVYLEPPSISVLKSRLLKDGRDKDGSRFRAGKNELRLLHTGKLDEKIDCRLITKFPPGKLAVIIHKNYLKAIG